MSTLVSGGQTGVDRAVLEVALARGIPYAGWCPAGGWAEDLTEPPGLLARYPALREAPGADPAERTRLNVRDSDAVLVVTRPGVRSPGTELTLAVARELGRAHLRVDVDAPELAAGWLHQLGRGLVLDVAGPRESEARGITRDARAFLESLLG